MILNTPVGNIELVFEGKFLKEIKFVKKPASNEVNKYSKQFQEYFSAKRKEFDFPLMLEGTTFELKVWKAMDKIPYGQTKTYKEIARQIKNPNAYRAVANACGKNPLPIVVPCHRVVASSGIGGYSAGIVKKKKLLVLEMSSN